MAWRPSYFCFFFFNDTATTEIYTLSLHDALPISPLEGSIVSKVRPSAAPTQSAPIRSLCGPFDTNERADSVRASVAVVMGGHDSGPRFGSRRQGVGGSRMRLGGRVCVIGALALGAAMPAAAVAAPSANDVSFEADTATWSPSTPGHQISDGAAHDGYAYAAY